TKDVLGLGKAAASSAEASSSSESDDSSNDNAEVEATSTGSNNDSGNEEAGEDDPHAPAPMSLYSNEDSAPAADGSAVGKAQSLLGTPYVWGGKDPNVGLDSSGFINEVYGVKGTHEDMWASVGTEVSDPQPGDVVFFEGTYKDGVSHSGVYIGNGQMIHAGTEKTGVEETSMEIGY